MPIKTKATMMISKFSSQYWNKSTSNTALIRYGKKRFFSPNCINLRNAADNSSAVPNKKEVAKVVVVGSGRMGQIRADILQSNPRFNFLGVVDVNTAGAEALAKKHGVKAFFNLDAVMDHCSKDDDDEDHNVLDGIVICTPTMTHEQLIREAASHSVSVFTEKPVDESAEKIRHCFTIAEAAGIDLCCGFQRRFDTSYVAASDAIRNGKIGDAVYGNIFFADHPVPHKEFLMNSGGDIFVDLSAHDVDFITHALQDDVVSVYANASSSSEEMKQAGVADSGMMVLNFRRTGASVILFLSRYASYGYDQRCEVFGPKGLVTVMNQLEHSTILSNADGTTQSRLKHSFPQRFEQAFVKEMDVFADTLLLGTPWPVSADQCIHVQQVADAAKRSCEQGNVVMVG